MSCCILAYRPSDLQNQQGGISFYEIYFSRPMKFISLVIKPFFHDGQHLDKLVFTNNIGNHRIEIA